MAKQENKLSFDPKYFSSPLMATEFFLIIGMMK